MTRRFAPNLPEFPDTDKKVIIFGSRTFDDYQLLRRKMDFYVQNFWNVVVVTGAAKGADTLGEWWAFLNRYTVVRFHAEWDKYGKKAGPIRNEEMAAYVGSKGVAVGFWDGKSPGTKDMIQKCKRFSIRLKIVRF